MRHAACVHGGEWPYLVDNVSEHHRRTGRLSDEVEPLALDLGEPVALELGEALRGASVEDEDDRGAPATTVCVGPPGPMGHCMDADSCASFAHWRKNGERSEANSGRPGVSSSWKQRCVCNRREGRDQTGCMLRDGAAEVGEG